MKRYLMEVYHSFMGRKEFEVEAFNEKDAIARVLKIIGDDEHYYLFSLKCVKKIRRSHEKKPED